MGKSKDMSTGMTIMGIGMIMDKSMGSMSTDKKASTGIMGMGMSTDKDTSTGIMGMGMSTGKDTRTGIMGMGMSMDKGLSDNDA